jgi:CRISPR/Cas system-associated exonuclease Cas4 (RecB family)
MRPTASRLGRLRHCQWWARPEVTAPEQPGGPEAERGTRIHDAIHLGTTLPIAEERACAEHARRHLAELGEHATEVPFVWLPATGAARQTKLTGPRQYGNAEGITGTADVVVKLEDGGVHVIDWKTGQPPPFGHTEPAASNAQLAFLALAATRAYGADYAEVSLGFLSDEGIRWDEASLDALDLDAYAHELRSMLAAVSTSVPQPGSHCKYCNAAVVCPAATGALDIAIEQKPVLPRRRLPLSVDHIESADHARWAYVQLRAVQALTDAAWRSLRDWTDMHGAIDLGDGHSYARRSSERESVEATPEAISLLQAELGPRWTEAVTMDTSKAAIQRAAESPKAARAIVDKLRNIGAVVTKTSVTHAER